METRGPRLDRGQPRHPCRDHPKRLDIDPAEQLNLLAGLAVRARCAPPRSAITLSAPPQPRPTMPAYRSPTTGAVPNPSSPRPPRASRSPRRRCTRALGPRWLGSPTMGGQCVRKLRALEARRALSRGARQACRRQRLPGMEPGYLLCRRRARSRPEGEGTRRRKQTGGPAMAVHRTAPLHSSVIVRLPEQAAGRPAETLPHRRQTHDRHPVRYRQQFRKLQSILGQRSGRLRFRFPQLTLPPEHRPPWEGPHHRTDQPPIPKPHDVWRMSFSTPSSTKARARSNGTIARPPPMSISSSRHRPWNNTASYPMSRSPGTAASRGQRSARCPDRVGLAGVCVTLVAATMRSITRSPNGRCAAMGRQRDVETRSNLNESAFGLMTGMRKHIFQEVVPNKFYSIYL